MKHFTFSLVFLILQYCLGNHFLAAQASYQSLSQELREAKPTEVGMSAERLQRLDNVVEDYMSKKWLPGATVIVARQGKIVYHKAFGTSGIGNDQAMKKDDLFRIMSMTKPIVSVALMMLYEEGKFLLDDPLHRYIPEFKSPTVLKTFNEKDTTYTTEPAKGDITIRQILSHTSGIAYGFIDAKKWGAILAKAKVPDFATGFKLTIGDRMKLLAKVPLVHNPGEKWTYGLNTDVCGYLVEVLSGMSLSDFCEKRIFQPLGMNDTHFFYPESAENRLVHVYQENKEGKVEKAKDPNEYKRVEYPTKGAKTYFSGGSGLCSTALDYLKFCQMVMNGGEFNNQRLLGRKTIELMGSNQIGDLPMGWGSQEKFGLGFSVGNERSATKKLGSAGRLGWGGALATNFWIDPKEKVAVVIMLQIYPFTHGDIFERIENAVYQSIVD
ncbi:MAG: beta-lactamase family protein [Microscillaceae bacterium]|jgi:CubicO group peptidase (beta-lactamase class C family)|nr:beta-lactamase family protein [Microscillaceae bacterium]